MITELGGAGIASAVAVKALTKWFGDAALQQLRHLHDVSLEELRGQRAIALEEFRADRSHQSELITAALSTRHSESMAAQERRLGAIDEAWSYVSDSNVAFVYRTMREPASWRCSRRTDR